MVAGAVALVGGAGEVGDVGLPYLYRVAGGNMYEQVRKEKSCYSNFCI